MSNAGRYFHFEGPLADDPALAAAGRAGLLHYSAFPGAVETGPVSYTHLDVYKRQGLHRNAGKVLRQAFSAGKIGPRLAGGHPGYD